MVGMVLGLIRVAHACEAQVLGEERRGHLVRMVHVSPR